MTQDEKKMLERGRVLAAPIMEAVHRYVLENGQDRKDDQADLTCLAFMSERADISYETLVSWVEKPWRVGDIPFDIADRLLCAIDQTSLWYGELHEYYMGVDLNWFHCACNGCSIFFYADPHKHGKKPIYCSKACANAASRLQRGESKKRIKNYGSRLAPRKGGKCRNGHERTPENQILLSGGKLRCRECNRESSARAYKIRHERDRTV